MGRARALATACGACSVLACQVGSVDVPIGADRPSQLFVGPAGDDDNPGTREQPWRTLRHATEALRPGQTLVLLDGEYRADTTGLLNVDCARAPRSGKASAPITVTADNERGAVLHGDGAAVPLQLSSCAFWHVEGLVLENEHVSDVAKGTDVGSIAVLKGGHDLVLRRLLMLRPNHERHTHVLRVLQVERALVEECEAYDFFHNAFEAVRSQAITFRRNYFHSRYAVSSGNTVAADDPTRGEIAIQLEESSSCLLENNLAEVVGTGFTVVARTVGSSFTDPSPYPVSGARLFGNLVRDASTQGFKVESRCDAAMPCDLPERIVRDTLIVNGVAWQTPTGVLVEAGRGTRVDNVTLKDVVHGVELNRSQANAGLDFSASAARALVSGFSGVAFSASGPSDWSWDHCAALAPATDAVAFSPDDERVLLPVSAGGDDACVAYLGPQSALRGAAGVDGDVGANVVFRYLDGALTDEPLWDPVSGAFPCGAIVAGINDDPSESCSGAHERFRVGTQDCALPDAAKKAP